MQRRRSSSRTNYQYFEPPYAGPAWPTVIEPIYYEYIPALQEHNTHGKDDEFTLEDLKSLLNTTGESVIDTLWEKLVVNAPVAPRLSTEFSSPPISPNEAPQNPPEPIWKDFAPKKSSRGFLSTLFEVLSGRAGAKIRVAEREFEYAKAEWNRNRVSRELAMDAHLRAVKRYEAESGEYKRQRTLIERTLANATVRHTVFKQRLHLAVAADKEALTSLVQHANEGSVAGIEALAQQIPRTIPMTLALPDVQATFDQSNGILLYTISLPNLENANLCVELKTKFRKATDKEVRTAQEFLLHALSLRIIHEVFATSEMSKVQMVGLNMKLEFINRHNGRWMNEIIGSLAVTRSEFASLNIAEVNPKLCFRSLKGVAAPSFQDLSAVRPVLIFDRDDKRIVEGREVVDKLEAETNLAAMDWEDFEHVVRELFSKMFSARNEFCRGPRNPRQPGLRRRRDRSRP